MGDTSRNYRIVTRFFGGVIVNQPISGIDSFYVPNPGITGLRLFLNYNYYSEPGPIFSSTPETITFPPLPIGDTLTLTSSITNLGTINDLLISNIISSNPLYNIDLNTLPIQIEPQSTYLLNVTYTSVAGEQNGFLEILHNGVSSPDTIHLYSSTQNLLRF